MTILDSQIKALHEEHECTPEEIAGELGVDELAVRVSLEQFSTKFRKAEKAEGKPFVNEEQLDRLKIGMFELAMSANNEGVRAKMLQFCWNEAKGRNDVDKRRQQDAPHVNVIMFNAALQRSKIATEGLKSMMQLDEAVTA